jgi:glycosyltransferase involved in cell wall biosynthesis
LATDSERDEPISEEKLMRIALIGHGNLPIPPQGWGAVEGTIWQRVQHLRRRGHTVDVYNSRAIDEVVAQVDDGSYDFVHCHNERFASACNERLRSPFALTSHDQYLYRMAREDERLRGLGHGPSTHFPSWFADTLHVPANLVLSPPIAVLYRRHGYGGFLGVVRNAVETECFRLAEVGNGRAICLGRVSARKRQAWLAEVVRGRVPVDFVGPRAAHEPFEENDQARYLGEWSKATVYERLTEYSCLVLLSKAENAPKVVIEGLAAGLSVVISEASAANLTNEPFITVHPDEERSDSVITSAIEQAIAGNAAMRPAIRAYAERYFDYGHVIDHYLRLIHEFRLGITLDNSSLTA